MLIVSSLTFLFFTTFYKNGVLSTKTALEFSPQKLKDVVASKEKYVLVMFYAPWCPHCQDATPFFTQAASELKGKDLDKVFAMVNCDDTKNHAFCNEQRVEGFPTYKIFLKDGTSKVIQREFRSGEEFVSLMKDPASAESSTGEDQGHQPSQDTPMPDVTYLAETNFSIILNKTMHAIVFFYAPWCPHCIQAKPTYNKAAKQLKGNKERMLLAVNCDARENQKLCEAQKVEGFPSVRYYKNGEVWGEYEDTVTETNLLKYLSNPPKQKVPIQSYKDMNQTEQDSGEKDGEKPIKEEEMKDDTSVKFDVPHLNGETFPKSISKKGVHYFVMFYAPWCSHCAEMKPKFMAAAKKVANKYQDRILVAVNCDNKDSQALCEKEKVEGFPTLAHYTKGRKVYEHAESPATEKGIVDYVSSIKAVKDEL